MVGANSAIGFARLSMLDRKLLRDLSRLKGQAAAIAVVVASGVALLIATFGCLSSLKASRDAFYDQYRFADVFASLKRAPESLIERLRSIDGISQVETRIVADVILDIDGMSEPGTGRLISIPENQRPLLNDIELRSGRLISPEHPAEVIASEAFAKAHALVPGSQLRATLNGKKRLLTVVGIALTPEYVYSLPPGQFMPDDKRFGVLWMGRRALAAAFDLDEAFNSVTATLRHDGQTEDVLARLDDELMRYGGTGAYARADQISHFFLTNELAQLQTTGTIAPPIFLAVAAFLLNIVLTRLLATEREEIGLLKAFGYTDRAVAWHYAKMMLALIVLGLLLGLIGGILLGRAMTDLYAHYYRFPILSYWIDPTVFMLAAGVSVMAGFAGGFNAVRGAARLAPAVAMAPPVPPAFRQTRLATLFAAAKVSQPTRMIYRHITRWPLRTGLNTAGLATAVGLLVASLFFLDTVERVIDVVFSQAERQTLTVTFVEPRSAIAERQIQALPGVLATQPLRAVSARITHGTHAKRVAINGIPPGADLSRLLDTDTHPVDPPHGGIALSRHIAEELQAKVGDIVTVEVMQERRPVRDVPVTRIIEEYMGFGSYMRLAALNQLMLEGPTVSGIHILADSQHLNELYKRLENMPSVAGVGLTEAALVGFRTTMANTMYVIIGFYIGFAALIAAGVSYNTARVTMSERAHALASLRVLGFTRAETAYILLGELWCQTLLALPIGCAMGYGLAWAMAPMLTTDMYQFPMVINASTYGLAMTVVLIASLVCSIFIARRLYGLNLVVALKTRD